MITELAYDGLGNRLAQVVAGVTTAYGLDIAGGLPQVIVETAGGQTTAYRPAWPRTRAQPGPITCPMAWAASAN